MNNSKSPLLPDSPALPLPALEFTQVEDNRELLEAVLDHIPDGILIARAPDGEILLMNRAARQMRGTLPEKTKFKDFGRYWRLHYPDGKCVPTEQAPLMRAFRGQSQQQQEFLFTGQDGRRRHHLISFGPLHNPDGSIAAGILVFRDITEKRHMEDVLQEREERYRQIFENASDAIYTHDLQGNFITGNHTALQMFGYTAEEFSQLNVEQLLIAEQREEAYARFQKKLAGEVFPPQEVEIVTKEGRRLTIEASSSVIYDDGKAVGMQGIARDVTERRRREKEIGSLQERLLKAFQASPYPLGITKVGDSRYLDVNEAAVRQTGYSRDELLGRTPDELGLLENVEAFQRLREAFAKQGSLHNFELEFITKAGDKRIGLFSANLVELDNEPFVLSSTIDITEQRRVERLQAAAYEISQAANSATNLQMLFQSVHRIMERLLKIDNFYVALPDPDDQLLRIPYIGDDNSARSEAVQHSHGITEYVLKTAQPLYATPDTFRELAQCHEISIMGRIPAYWFGVPLQTPTQTIGVLAIQGYQEGAKLSEEERHLMVFVSNQVAMAIERKRAEEAIRASREWFRKAFDLSPNAMCINHLKSGIFVDINNRFLESLGYLRAEILGQSPAEINIWRSEPQQEQVLQVLKTERKISNLEMVFYTKAGEIRYALLSADIIEMNGDYFVLSSLNDITARKRDEQEIAASNERFSKAFHSSPMQMSITRIADGRYIDINDSFLQITGYQREELIGRTSLEINIWADAGQRNEIIALLQKDGSFSNREIKFQMKSKEIGIFLVSAEIITLNGEQCLLMVANDITERKHAEEALQASEERFSKIFHANPLPMSLLTFKEGRILDVNESSLANGFSREELLGRTWNEIGIWGDDETPRKIINLVKNRQSIRGMEVKFRKKSGELIQGLLSAELLRIEDELCVLTSLVDITERKKQEEMIQAAEREWQTTFEALPDSIFVVDKNDRLLRANQTFFERNQFKPEEVIGKEVRSLFHSQDDFISAEACPLCELRIRHQRGSIELPAGVLSTYPLFASIEPIFDDNHEVIATVQVMRDLSALYSAREETEQERGSLKATLEHMADGLLLFDDKGNVVRANSAAQKLYGFTLEQMQNSPPGSLVTGRLSDKDGKVLTLEEYPSQVCLREQRHVEEQTYIYERPDEQKFFVSITASPFFNEIGKLSGVVAVIRDITRQQREQERLQQADKLRALGQLASGVAHNFNNALAAVIGYSQLALRKTQDQEVQKHLRVIEQSSKDAARMVERIQNFSRSRSQADEFTTVRIVDIVRDAIDITRPRWRYDAESVGIRYNLTLQWQVEEERYVLCEPSELREVFVNLIFNALDAMPAGGDLTITADADSDHIWIHFRDTGIGMSEEVKSRIFDPFFTTKGVLGLGLGLSESYRIVERHGGSFDVESKPNNGATFTLHLPLQHLEIRNTKRTSTETPAYRMRVLVLDDEELVRYALVSVLEELGHEAVQASTGEEALERLSQEPFDIVFTDLAMPDMDGVMAAKEIKARNPRVTLILMSGYSYEKIEERAKGSDFIDGVMLKPFKIDEIQQTLKEIIKKRRAT